MNYQIYLGRDGRTALHDQFNISTSTISEILRFKRSNKRAAMVRSYAVNKLKGLLLAL